MDEQTKRLVEEAEARAGKAIAAAWTIADPIYEDFLAHKTDMLAPCTKVRELAELNEELAADVEAYENYEEQAMLQIGHEVIAGRTCERGELVYWINQIHEHYQKRLRDRDTEARESTAALVAENQRLKEAYERECDKVLDLQGATPWNGD